MKNTVPYIASLLLLPCFLNAADNEQRRKQAEANTKVFVQLRADKQEHKIEKQIRKAAKAAREKQKNGQ